MDFQFHHPLVHKLAVARTLFDHAEKVYVDFLDTEKVREHVAYALHNNGYPRGLVMRNWRPPSRSQWPEQLPVCTYLIHLLETI